MKACLMVMNPREIPSCIEAIENLKIDKAWFKYFTEKALEERINEFIQTSNYDNYLILSDDTKPTQEALDAVLWLLITKGVATGWSNNHPNGNGANLMLYPMKGLRWALTRGLLATRFADENVLGIGFEKIDKVKRQAACFRTYFVGFSLTGMNRDLWLDFPFKTIYSKITKRFQSSDLCLSKRLQDAGIPAYCARDAFVYHLKSRQNFMVGKKEPQVIFQKAESEEYDADYIHT